jgi:GNAT superfamily N-acetyltransferase
MTYVVGDYGETDEGSWLRCRVLSFLDTSYFDDVRKSKTSLLAGSFALVAVDETGQVCALLDVERQDDELATIDSIAVHPDHQRHGLASQLLQEALVRLAPRGALDAWTRGDVAANAWYRSSGFTIEYQYLHAYLHGASAQGLQAPPGVRVQAAFVHANLEDETAVRALTPRVYRCTRYVRHLG